MDVMGVRAESKNGWSGPSKMGKSPKFGKAVKFWKWLDIWCVASMRSKQAKKKMFVTQPKRKRK